MNYTKFDWHLPSSLARAIRCEHRIHSPDVTPMLWLTASHTWVARAKQVSRCPIEACIGVMGIQDICHFTFRDIGHYPFYFQGYRILYSISGILCFLPKNEKKKQKNKKNSKRPFERRELKKKTFIRKIFWIFTTLLFWWRVFTNSKKKAFRNV